MYRPEFDDKCRLAECARRKWAAVKRKRLISRSIFKALTVIEVSTTGSTQSTAIIAADTDRQVLTISTAHC